MFRHATVIDSDRIDGFVPKIELNNEKLLAKNNERRQCAQRRLDSALDTGTTSDSVFVFSGTGVLKQGCFRFTSSSSTCTYIVLQDFG